MFDADGFYSKLGQTFKPSVLTRIILSASELVEPGKRVVPLTGGFYDPPSFPVEEIKAIFSEASAEAWEKMLQYGSDRGNTRLRAELSRFMEGTGIEADPKSEVIVLTGSQQGLDLTSRIFIDPGDVIVVGSPTYLQALSAFRQFRPEFCLVPVDGDGMDTDALESKLRRMASRGKAPKLLYTVPSFQNPTSAVMTRDRRLRLMELAEEFNFIIVEDNPYGYISYEGSMPAPVKSLDRSGRVIYTSTFSKIVSPGLRIGWVAAREEFVTKMAVAKGNVDICTDSLSQYVAAELLRRGVVKRQISRVTSVYRRKRDLMLEAMETYFPEEAEWNEPKGGLFLWVKMPVDPSINNYIRLNYSFPSEEEIVEGTRILGGLLKKKI